jgi:hypothetical protein
MLSRRTFMSGAGVLALAVVLIVGAVLYADTAQTQTPHAGEIEGARKGSSCCESETVRGAAKPQITGTQLESEIPSRSAGDPLRSVVASGQGVGRFSSLGLGTDDGTEVERVDVGRDESLAVDQGTGSDLCGEDGEDVEA